MNNKLKIDLENGFDFDFDQDEEDDDDNKPNSKFLKKLEKSTPIYISTLCIWQFLTSLFVTIGFSVDEKDNELEPIFLLFLILISFIGQGGSIIYICCKLIKLRNYKKYSDIADFHSILTIRLILDFTFILYIFAYMSELYKLTNHLFLIYVLLLIDLISVLDFMISEKYEIIISSKYRVIQTLGKVVDDWLQPTSYFIYVCCCCGLIMFGILEVNDDASMISTIFPITYILFYEIIIHNLATHFYKIYIYFIVIFIGFFIETYIRLVFFILQQF